MKRIKAYIPVILVFILLQPKLAGAQWIRKADAIKKRSEVTSIVYNNKLYTFLGFGDADLNSEPSVEVYDPASDTWELLASIAFSKSKTHQGVVLIDDNVWHIGGRVGKNPAPLSSEIWIYNITKNSWSPGPEIEDPATGQPLVWAGGGAALLGRTLHIFGGFTPTACHDQDAYHLTLDVDEWLAQPERKAPWKNELAPLPLKRNHFATVVLGGKIYAIGGQFGHDCDGGDDKRYSHVYNPATDTWKELSLLPAPRSHIEGSTFAIDGKIYVVSGQGANGENTNRVIIFDPARYKGKGKWTYDDDLKLPKRFEGLSAKVINSTFIISHGGEGSSRNVRNLTYSRTIARNPVPGLGFPSECLTLDNSSRSALTGRTWLYTIDGTKAYTTFSNAGWLKVTRNSAGTANPNAVDIEVTADATGLAPGSYGAVITAIEKGNTGALPAKLCVNLLVHPKKDTPAAFITDIVSASGHEYLLSTLAEEAQPFSDRTYQVTSLPASLDKAPLIRTANDDKENKSSRSVSFTINRPAIVYVAYDPRATALPQWMHDFKKLSREVGITDDRVNYMQLYSKEYAAGTITLGGNLQRPASGALNNFFIIVQPLKRYPVKISINGNGWVSSDPAAASYDSATNVTLTAVPDAGQRFTGWSGSVTSTSNPLRVTVNGDKDITATFMEQAGGMISNIRSYTGGTCTLGKLVAGAMIYTDRTYRATTIPGFLNNAPFIKTPIGDKGRKDTEALSFDLRKDADVYVAYDPRAASLPVWLNNWEKIETQIGREDLRITYMEVYRKAFPAGKVVLGGNLASPAKGALSNYFVIVPEPQAQQRLTNEPGADSATMSSLPGRENVVWNELKSSIIRVYPNPNTGEYIRIEAQNFPKHAAVNLLLRDIFGNVMASIKATSDERGAFKRTLQTARLKKGLYIISAVSTSGNIQRKFVVN